MNTKSLLKDKVILVVDDEPDILETVEEQLDMCLLHKAKDYDAALQYIMSYNYDVVILDIRMPGGNGIDVLQAIKRGDPAPTVIMLTNYPYPQYRGKCMDLGADYFFDKSNEFEKVMEVIEQLIKDDQ